MEDSLQQLPPTYRALALGMSPVERALVVENAEPARLRPEDLIEALGLTDTQVLNCAASCASSSTMPLATSLCLRRSFSVYFARASLSLHLIGAESSCVHFSAITVDCEMCTARLGWAAL